MSIAQIGDALATVAMGDREDTSAKENAKDMANGAKYIPREVTTERQKGYIVDFMQESQDPATWYWLLARKDEAIPYVKSE